MVRRLNQVHRRRRRRPLPFPFVAFLKPSRHPFFLFLSFAVQNLPQLRLSFVLFIPNPQLQTLTARVSDEVAFSPAFFRAV